MLYKFIDNQGTFTVKNPQNRGLYFPLTDQHGKLLCSISPNLAGDIKADNDHFLTPPVSMVDLNTNLLCRRDFFIGIKSPKKIIRLSYPADDKLEAGFLYHKITKNFSALQVEILNFVPFDLPVEITKVTIRNKKRKPISIIPTSFMPLYGRSEKNIRDHRHVSSLLNRIRITKYGINLKPTIIFNEKGHTLNKTVYYTIGFEGNKLPPLGQFPTLDYFCGSGDLIQPEAITGNIHPINKNNSQFNGKETIASFRFSQKTLKKNQEIQYSIITGIDSDNGKKIQSIFSQLDSPLKINNKLEETKKYWTRRMENINFDFKQKTLNNWLRWVKLQPVLRKLFGCSFLPHFDYGKGGRGWRDLWQDVLSLLLTEPLKAKKLILKSFSGIRIDGTNATIITKEGKFISDRNSIPRVWIDHGIWPYLTLRSYIHKTGDINILTDQLPYFQDHLVMRAQEKTTKFCSQDYLLRTKTKKIYKGTVLEHLLIQHLTAFFNVGKHNIIRLENADWNDGLDMASTNGESVTFSFMYAHNLNDICFFIDQLTKNKKTIELAKELTFLLGKMDLCLEYTNYRKNQKRLKQYLSTIYPLSGTKIEISSQDLISKLRQMSSHLFSLLKKQEWIKHGFFNGYYDNHGKRVEGILKNKPKIMLPSQVFALMSKGVSKKQAKKIYSSVSKYLKDKTLGGFRLNTNFQNIYLDLGRAFAFSYGDKENGAIFNHMSVMLSNSLYKNYLIKEACYVLLSIYKMCISDKANIYPVIPEYFNNEGKGLYSYLTGSASWFVYTLIEETLGFKFFMGNLLIEPKLDHSFFFKDSIEFSGHLHNRRIKVSFIKSVNQKKIYKMKKITLNNKLLPTKQGKCLINKAVILTSDELHIKAFLG